MIHNYKKTNNNGLSFLLERISNIISIIIIGFVKIYQFFISPILPTTCRYYPTCSEYTIIAFKKYTFIKAFQLSVGRLLRCHPGHVGGYDPLP